MAQPRGGHSFELEVLSEIEGAETIAVGPAIREFGRLKRVYGRGRWRKRKGLATVRVGSGDPFRAEVHWYEAHGIGRKEYKIKRILDG